MEAKATSRYVRMAPRKIRLVVDLVRGKRVEEALNILAFTPKVAAHVVKKLIKSAVANAENKGDIDVDTLYVKLIYVNEGPVLKRFTPRAMGRATMIRKRTSHVTVVLDEV